MKVSKAVFGMFCQPHRERAGIEKPASVTIAGTPMCRACFRGQSPPLLSKFLTERRQDARSRRAQAFAPMRKSAHVLPGNPSQHRTSKSEWAMAIARAHPEKGIGGSGNLDPGWQRSRGKFSWAYLRIARVVLRQSPELADKVTNGTLTLTQAYAECKKSHPSDVDLVPEKEPYQHIKGTKAQRAMALAMRFPGYQSKGGDRDARKYIESGGFSVRHFKRARWILRKSPKVAEAVLRGEVSLNAAVKIARCRSRVVGYSESHPFRIPSCHSLPA
jgi:hypothetical protein